MAYQALYRKWRPVIFDDVVGQEHITTTLKNELLNGRLGHAYLFCGTRGTGKTSTAKIFARAINCTNNTDGNPCNTCDTCRGILDESILDVVEMDAASNTGVDDIRRIIEDAMFLPTAAAKKVYIIDEVHMISTSAFNALLKTLEEPPPHVVFILATTEPHKLPATVLSRCQRFDFRRITAEDIMGRMKIILDGEGLSVEEEGLRLVAELGDGSMRDALSILDGCLAYVDGTLTYDDIKQIIGIADDDALADIAGAIARNDCAAAMESLAGVLAAGRDLRAFMEMLIKYLRDILIVKLTAKPNDILGISSRKLDQLSGLAKELTQEKLTYALDQLGSAVAQAKGSVFSATVFELAMIKICDSSVEDSREALLDRVAVLERKVAEGISAPAPTVPSAPPPPAEAPKPKPQAAAPSKQPKAPAEPAPNKVHANGRTSAEVKKAIDQWDEIKLYLRSHGGLPICSHFAEVRLRDINGRLGIIFPDARAMNRNLVNRPGTLTQVTEAIRAVTGVELEVKCLLEKETGDMPGQTDAPKQDAMDALAALADQIPGMTVIDE